MNSTKKKIVITGAPSSGKSTILTSLSLILANQAVFIPESAVVLLSGGFPAPSHNDLEQIRVFQKAIVQVQISLELIFTKQHPEKNLMIYDRGALDGAGFWPPGVDDYFESFKINIDEEFNKYNYVLFFELPDERHFGGVNRLRFHNYQQCLDSEKKLKAIWSKHPHFIEIKATEAFDEKIQTATSIIQKIANNLA